MSTDNKTPRRPRRSGWSKCHWNGLADDVDVYLADAEWYINHSNMRADRIGDDICGTRLASIKWVVGKLHEMEPPTPKEAEWWQRAQVLLAMMGVL